jgi:glycerol kinase
MKPQIQSTPGLHHRCRFFCVIQNTYGTGCFLLLNTGHTPVPSRQGLLTTLGYQINDQRQVYCLEGSIAITGALVQWQRDNLGLISSAPDIEELAGTEEDNGGAYFVPAFSGLFAPYWRSDARGVIAGLTRFVNKGHIARAVLEASAYQTRDIVEAMNKDSGVVITKLKVAVGFWSGPEELRKNWAVDKTWQPDMDSNVRETYYRQWKKAVDRTFNWVD